eukprot:GHVP01048220.1.p1 GENE.GHVP01048220.1~~GHVP01048220.1.p1  ORF type:complete len:227 (+),score=51.09 GHVP01048220.1:45-725(+)
MAADDTIWEIVGSEFCSFRKKLQPKCFCKHTENVTGLCNRTSCPLANGTYATVKEEQGEFFLWVKEVERQHLPRHMWEKIKLSGNWKRAIREIERALNNLVTENRINECKARYLALRRVLKTTRKLAQNSTGKLVVVKKKTERREKAREAAALQAAKLEHAVERELLDRLKEGVYGELYERPVQKELSEEEDEEVEYEEGESESDSEAEEERELIVGGLVDIEDIA